MAEYIEREAALIELCRGCSLHSIGNSFFCGESCPKYERITSIPAVDVQPVRHGRYITDDMGDSSCSECGERYLDVTQKYCPNCGAKMDKEEK